MRPERLWVWGIIERRSAIAPMGLRLEEPSPDFASLQQQEKHRMLEQVQPGWI